MRVASLNSRITAFWMLGRTGAAPLTISAAILGNTVQTTDSQNALIWLAVTGLAAHLFGFSLNDILDRSIDRNCPNRRGHPLVTNQISLPAAWTFCLLQIPIAFWAFLGGAQGSIFGAITLAAALLLATVYNLYSKRGWLPRTLAELSLAVSIGTLCFAGVLTTGNTNTLSIEPLLVSAALAVVLLGLNSVPSGLKDLKSDQASGVRSFVLAMGARVLPDGELCIPLRLRNFAFSVQSALGLVLMLEWWVFRPHFFITSVSLGLWSLGYLHLRALLGLPNALSLSREQLLLNGIFNYLAVTTPVLIQSPIVFILFWLYLLARALSIPLGRVLFLWQKRYWIAD